MAANKGWYQGSHPTRERMLRLRDAPPSDKSDQELIDQHLVTKGATVCPAGTAENATKSTSSRHTVTRRRNIKP